MRALFALLTLLLLGTTSHAVRAESLDFTKPLRAESLDFTKPVLFDAFDRDRDESPAEKAAARNDGVYGRFDGQLTLEPFVGATYTHDGFLTDLAISAYYLHTVGLSAKYSDGRLFPASPRSDFNLSTVALSLRPLFLLRWSKDLERGPSWLDLTIDSLTLTVGGFWAIDNDHETSQRGLETELSMAFPLLARADGPWLGLAIGQRYPRVTHDGHSVDLTAGLRLGWAFSLSP